MSKTYGIISDIHLHRWSAFAQADEHGVNTRLRALLGEIHRAAFAVKDAGGDTLFCAGDLFHVRGQVAPSVLNPTLDCFEEIRASLGIRTFLIPGNHDLEGKESTRLGSAVTALSYTSGCSVLEIPQTIKSINVVAVPWVDDVATLKQKLTDLAASISEQERECLDLIIHAPVNGVILGIPDHGLEPAWLHALGFNRVFSGHYHNHLAFDGGVYSIGALAHHTWGDVGSKAGFLIVHEDSVEHVESSLPKFVDVAADMKPDAVATAIVGNYARVRMSSSKSSDVEKMRAWLMGQGALGVIVMSVKASVEERDGTISASVNAGASVSQSVSEFIAKLTTDADKELVTTEALKVLAEAGAIEA